MKWCASKTEDKYCYQPGDNYTYDGSATLFAWWNKNSGGTTTETYKCYLASHKYVWASTKPSGGTEVSRTESQCTGCESGYKASGSTCVKETTTTSSQKTTTPSTPQEIEQGPQTGTTAIIIAWVAGLIAIGYSFWYFVKSSKIKNN